MMPNDTEHTVVIRDIGGEVSGVFTDIIGDRAEAINKAWFVLGRFGGARDTGELYAGTSPEFGPPIWDDKAKFVLQIATPKGLDSTPDDTEFP